jgi:spore maturation protein CgeB
MTEAAPLRVVVLGLSLSSSWGNGHATTWRALLKAFSARGHDVVFLERDAPWYAANRDLVDPDFCRLHFYHSLAELARWRPAIAAADAVLVGSFVSGGVAVGDLVHSTARGVTAFYDIDTPLTLGKLARGEEEYLAARQIAQYDLYLSFTGGPVLQRLREQYGSPATEVLYCSADTDLYRPLPLPPRWDLSYLGTYSADRQAKLERLLLEAARQAPELRFAVAGPQYPEGADWPANVERIDHVAPGDHPAFYARSRYTLNITRGDMESAGYSPSVRLFEAGACGTPVLSDNWPGIDMLFDPGRDILVVADTKDVLRVIRDGAEERRRDLGVALRRRVLASHTARHRALELECSLRRAATGLLRVAPRPKEVAAW